ncbi:MAG: hypothetical protein ACYC63_08550 [Armatimonadota bacterium]
MRNLILIPVLLLIASAAIAVPSQVFPVADGVVEIRDDMGVWGGLSNGITHMNKGDYTARKILDTSAVPAVDWNAAPEVRLSVFFMVRDYSKNETGTANGLDEKYQIVVNGKVHEYETGGGAPLYSESGMATGEWYDLVIPKGEFVHGANEILMRKSPESKGDDYLYLGIDNSQKRGNSAVAFDGKVWTQDKLTIPGGNGEYMIRLYLLSKPTRFEAKWQPGKTAASDDPQRFIAYAGGRNMTPTATGLTIPAGQSARVEWAAETLDKLEPVTATVQATGTPKSEWLDAQGTVAKGQAPAKDGQLALPGKRAFQPSGVLITATEAPVVLTGVTIAGSRSYHPLPVKVNIAPAIKAVRAPAPMKPSCKITNGEITLSGGQLRATFKRGSNLRLTSLYNNVTKTEMVRDPSASALFLVEVGDKRYAGNRDFKLTSVKPTENGFVAQMDLPDPALRGVLTVRMEASGLRMGFDLTNSGQKATDFKLAFPHLAGLAVSSEIKDDYYFYPWGGGIISDTAATIRRGYGDHEALTQLMDLYSPALGGGLYMRADDSEGWHKIVALRKHIPGAFDVNQEIMSMRVKPEYQWKPGALDVIDGTAMTYEYLRRTREPGGSFAPASAVLTAHAGDWHTAMSDYSKWAHRVWKFRPYPSALKSVRNMIAAGWGKSILFQDGKYRTDIIRPDTDCIELMSWWDWSPLGPFGTPFDQLDKVLTPAQIKMWEPYFVIDPVTGKKMWNNQPGDYDGYNPQFGGLPAFQQAVKTYQSMGALTTLYTDPFRMDFASKIGLAHGKEWGVINEKDELSTGYEVYNPCHDLPAVREWTAKAMGRVMRETGADGIRLDEYGHRGWACYNPAHKHTYAEPGITQWQKATTEATKMVHDEMDKVRPGLVLTTEHFGYDYMIKDLEGCITYDLTGQKSPLRPLECNTMRFYFPECKAYELDHRGADLLSRKKFWNAVESFGRYYPNDMYTILNENEDVYQGRDNLALAPTLQPYLYANRFSGAGKTMYHLYNAMGHTFEGPALAVPVKAGQHVMELLSCRELPLANGQANVYLERDDVACVAVLPKVIETARNGNALQVTLKTAGQGTRLVVTDLTGKELHGQSAKAGAQTLDLSGLEKPACVKLLRDGQLVDAAAL